MRRRLSTLICALALVLATMVGSAAPAEAHATTFIHAHYLDSFCNTQTHKLFHIYEWQWPSGDHYDYEWRHVGYCFIA